MKKNAFTLIELLAVILILGIIALIAIPTITKILDESKMGAFS
ncbi:MAG: prepilin-type N-terminal cleavage/methylation domain-containing protein, partial [Bacilli bacterium]